MGKLSLRAIVMCGVAILSCVTSLANAHHVLGRPAYSLNEDSNTPPSMQIETLVGNYFVTYMVYPAFPKANEPGRVNLYASRLGDGRPYDGKVHFATRHQSDSFFAVLRRMIGLGESQPETGEVQLGSQLIDDGVYRQGFLFKQNGDYIVTAKFNDDGEDYTIDLPIQIGATPWLGPAGVSVAFIICALIIVSVLQQKKVQRAKMQTAARASH